MQGGPLYEKRLASATKFGSALTLPVSFKQCIVKTFPGAGRTTIFITYNKKLIMSPGYLAPIGSPWFRGVTGWTTHRWKALGKRKLFVIKLFQWPNGLEKIFLDFLFFRSNACHSACLLSVCVYVCLFICLFTLFVSLFDYVFLIFWRIGELANWRTGELARTRELWIRELLSELVNRGTQEWKLK